MRTPHTSFRKGTKVQVILRDEHADGTDDRISIEEDPQAGDWRFFAMNAQGRTVDKFRAFASCGIPLNAR